MDTSAGACWAATPTGPVLETTVGSILRDAASEAAIIGVPDPTMNEELAAFVRTADEVPSVEALRAHVRERWDRGEFPSVDSSRHRTPLSSI